MQQQQAMAEAMATAGNTTEQWLSKLRSMEQLLFSAQSVQFLEIRKREAEAFRVCPAPQDDVLSMAYADHCLTAQSSQA